MSAAGTFNYITYQDIGARFDKRTLKELTDDDNNGEPDEDVVNDAILLREEFTEGFIKSGLKKWYPGVTIEQIRIAKPRTILLWITNLCRYDLYNRRNDVPPDVFAEYQLTLDQLQLFADKGTPELITEPAIERAGQVISGNMSEADLETEAAATDSLISYWKDML
ncbi:DUF1320 domain-containing protein [bacterium]|nr:DUF1320 domain-containing protein [bacterium]